MNSEYKIKISIVIVVKNDVENIERTLKSCIYQSFKYKEIIVIDGFSNDGTTEIINKYKKNIDYFICENDYGIYDAMNKGVKLASGEWVIFMNSGDIFYNLDALFMVSIEKLSKYSVIACGWAETGAEKKLFRPKQSIRYSMPTSHQAMLTKLNLVKKFMFESKYQIGADYNLVCNIIKDDLSSLYLYNLPLAIIMPGGFGRNITLYEKDYRQIVLKQFGLFSYIKYRLYKILFVNQS